MYTAGENMTIGARAWLATFWISGAMLTRGCQEQSSPGQIKQAYDDMFRLVDLNKDGRIIRPEWDLAVAKKMLSTTSADAVADGFDLNRDGAVTRLEVDKALWETAECMKRHDADPSTHGRAFAARECTGGQ